MSGRLRFSQAVNLLSADYLSSFIPRLLLAGAISCRGAISLFRWLQGSGCAWGFSPWTIMVAGRTWGSDCIWGVKQNSLEHSSHSGVLCTVMLLLIKAKLAPFLVSYLLVGLQMCMQMPPTPGGHYLIPVLQHPMNGRSVYWSVQETCSTTYQIHKRNIYSGTYFTLIYLQSLGPQTSTSTISTASVHQSPWTARTFQLTLITSQLDYCNSFTWFAPKIPPQTETHADPCCTYHPDLPPLRTDPQFSNSLKSCFTP